MARKRIVKVTAVNATGTPKLSIGEKVKLIHDPQSKGYVYDPKVIAVYSMDGTQVAVIGNKYGQTVINGTENNEYLYDRLEPVVEKELNGYFEHAAEVIDKGEVIFRTNRKAEGFILAVEIPVQESKGENTMDFVLNIRGSIREFKGKPMVLKELVEGNQYPLYLKKDGERLITYLKDEGKVVLAGAVSKAEEGDLDQLTAYVEGYAKSGQDVVVKATKTNGNGYIVNLSVDSKEFEDVLNGKDIKTLDMIKQEKLDQGIADEKTLDEIQSYLENNDVPEKLIKGVFESMIVYPDDVRHRIKKPKHLYINMGINMVKKAVIYMNKGKHLNFIGDKGIGKNVLIETLSWVYQRPLYSAAYHSQIDKMDILGGKTFETEVENGQTVTKMVFEKELLAEAMEVGGIMNPDEINAADPSILFLFHPVADDRRELEVPGYGLVKAHPNFSLITTMNEDYLGTNELNEAFKRRFTHFRFPQAESIATLLSNKMPDANPRDIKLCDEVYGSILKLVRSGQLTSDCVAVSNYQDVLEVAPDLGLHEALIDNIANQISDESYRATIINLIDDIVG